MGKGGKGVITVGAEDHAMVIKAQEHAELPPKPETKVACTMRSGPPGVLIRTSGHSAKVAKNMMHVTAAKFTPLM